MFSSLFNKIDALSIQHLLALAGGLIVLCQLVAMVVVVQGQVERAQARNASLSSAQLAKSDSAPKADHVADTREGFTPVLYSLR